MRLYIELLLAYRANFTSRCRANLLPHSLDSECNGLEDYLNDYGVYGNVDIVFDVEELTDSDDNDENPENASDRKRLNDVSRSQRQEIYEAMLERITNGKQKRDTTTIVANLFNVSIWTVQRVWRRAKRCRERGEPVDVSSRKPKYSGRKKKSFDLSTIAAIPLHKRNTIRKLAAELGVSKSWLHRQFKSGLLRRHSNALKPSLKEDNKKERLRWCISMLDPATLPHSPKFIEMDNIIHIDEKWFNATKKNRNFYMLPEEEDPYRTVQNKNAIDKLMFLGAIGKPKKDAEGNIIFNGKIGIWPFIRKVSQHISFEVMLFIIC
jgi:AraC-like DNA-binding protein